MNIPPPPPLPLPPRPHFFFNLEIGSWVSVLFTLSFFPLSCLGGDSASWDSLMWTSVPWRVACELVSLMSSHVMLGLCWLKGLCVFSCSLPPALSAHWPGSFMCCCDNTGVERIPTQEWELTPERNILRPFLPGIEPATFLSMFTHKRYFSCFKHELQRMQPCSSGLYQLWSANLGLVDLWRV